MNTTTTSAVFPLDSQALGYKLPGLALAGVLLINFLSAQGHDFQRSAEMLFLIAFGLLAVRYSPASLISLFSASLAGRATAVFFALGVVSATLSYSPRHAGFELSTFLLLLTVAVAIANDIAHGRQQAIRTVLQAVGFVCSLHAVEIVVDYTGAFVLGAPLELNDFTPGFSNIRFFNHVQTVLLPLLVLLACMTPATARLRMLWVGLASLWWMVIFATTGRGTLVGILAGCVFTAAILRRQSIPYLKTMAATAAIGIGLYVVFLVVVPMLAGRTPFDAFEYALQRSSDDPASRRLFIWKNAIGLICQHPWFGVGPMHFAHDAARFGWAAHPHDWILQIAAEWGLPALLCLGLALFLAVRALVRSRERAREIEGGTLVIAALLAGGAAILVDGLVSGLIVMPQSQLAIALYLGLAIGWHRMAAAPAPARAMGAPARAANVVLILAATVCVAWGVFPEMIEIMNALPPSPSSVLLNHDLHWPRLWEAGFF